MRLRILICGAVYIVWTSESVMYSRKHGFTLIELLVVIAIIALLMSIMMPALTMVKKQVKTVVCRANLRQWSIVWKMFTDDNESKFMSGNEYDSSKWFTRADGSGENENGFAAAGSSPMYNDEGTVWTGDHSWPAILWPYYRQRKLLCCSEAKKPPAMSAGSNRGEREYTKRGMLSTWGLWIRHPDDFFYGSYGVNSWIYDRGGNKNGMSTYWRHINQKGGNNIPIMMDCFWCEGFPHHTDQPIEYPTEWVGDPSSYMQRFCVDRHHHSLNVVFFDLSVRNLGLKGLWKIKWSPDYNINTPSPVWPEWMRNFKDY